MNEEQQKSLSKMLLNGTTKTTALVILCKSDDLMKLLEKALENGYGHLPAKWAISLYLVRN